MLKIAEIRKLATDRTLRHFGWLFLAFTIFTAWLQWQRGHSLLWSVTFLVLGITLCLVSQIKPDLVRPLFVGWMILLIPVNWIVSHVILGAMFFLVFTPIGLCRRALGADPLWLKKPKLETYWQSRPEMTDKRRYLKQY
jgi:hypothetical protein